MDKPIIESLLDSDFYKFTMGQLVFHRYPNVPVKYAFKNRTSGIRLADFIDETDLRRELNHIQELKFNNSELHYLRGTNEYSERMFKEDYLQFLAQLELPDYDLRLENGNYQLEFSGPWARAIYWEVPALAVIDELYFRELLARKSPLERDETYAVGTTKLAEKIRILRNKPGIKLSDFGTRRRFSRDWQDYVVKNLRDELPGQFLGTSNVYLAMKYGLLPMGTSAHEMYMVMSGITHKNDDEIRRSHNQVLRDWWDEYGRGLSVALTDTYGSNFFFRDMTADQARAWKGLRQDSGDPTEFGLTAIDFYRKHNIDPKEKLIIFSDGLDVDMILKLYRQFQGCFKMTFGWGTNLTNDLIFKPLSLVIKVVEANGYGVVKLGDNLAKAIGRPEDIERFKNVFGYIGYFYQECRY